MTASERLQKIKEQSDRATQGPWTVEGMDAGHSKINMHWHVSAGEMGDTVCDMDAFTRITNDSVAQDEGEYDARFIAASRTNVPAMSEALLSVLDLHKEHIWRGFSNGCVVCGHAPEGPAYPCPTVMRINQALDTSVE